MVFGQSTDLDMPRLTDHQRMKSGHNEFFQSLVGAVDQGAGGFGDRQTHLAKTLHATI
jgi:hypothetical protein